MTAAQAEPGKNHGPASRLAHDPPASANPAFASRALDRREVAQQRVAHRESELPPRGALRGVMANENRPEGVTRRPANDPLLGLHAAMARAEKPGPQRPRVLATCCLSPKWAAGSGPSSGRIRRRNVAPTDATEANEMKSRIGSSAPEPRERPHSEPSRNPPSARRPIANRAARPPEDRDGPPESRYELGRASLGERGPASQLATRALHAAESRLAAGSRDEAIARLATHDRPPQARLAGRTGQLGRASLHGQAARHGQAPRPGRANGRREAVRADVPNRVRSPNREPWADPLRRSDRVRR